MIFVQIVAPEAMLSEQLRREGPEEPSILLRNLQLYGACSRAWWWLPGMAGRGGWIRGRLGIMHVFQKMYCSGS